MLTIQDLQGDIQHLTGVTEVERSRKVNGEKTLKFITLPTESNAHSYHSVDSETRLTFEGEPYIIKNVAEKNIGETSIKQSDAVHTFFNTMINSFQYGQWSGSQTFQVALERVFNVTPFNYVITGSFEARAFENFGRDNSLALFKNVLDRYGAEFRIVGNTVYLQHEIGARTGFQMRWKHNVKAIEKTVETESLATVIKGFGGTPDDNGVYPIQREYRSNVDIHGELHASAVYDERLSTVEGMDARLRADLIDEPQLSITVDIAEVTGDIKNEGDYGYIIYEPMNIQVEARVVEITENFKFVDGKWRITQTTVTLSNFRNTLTDTLTRFGNVSKRVDRLFGGQDKLPFSALDEAVANATRILINDNANFEYAPGYILGVNEDNPNLLTRVTSRGLGISNDGGQTFKTAITGDGIVADVVTSGTINADFVRIGNSRVMLDNSGIGVYSAGRLGAKLNDGALNFFDLTTGESIGRFSSSVLGDSPTTKGISMNLMNNKYMSFGYYKNVEEGFRPAMSINMSGMNSASIGAEGVNIFTDATFHSNHIRSYSDLWMGAKTIRFGNNPFHNHATIYKSAGNDLIIACYDETILSHISSGGVTNKRLSVGSNTVDIWQDLDMHGWRIINSPTIINLIQRVQALENA